MGEVDEEEELLQRALEEQAAREVSYQRPPNYPPPTVSPAASGPPPKREPPRNEAIAPAPRRAPPAFSGPQVRREPVVVGPPIGDEDESDVELLSISSEDEDEGHQQGRPPAVVQSSHVQNKAVGGRGGRGAEQQQQLLLQDDGDDDDLGWDEEGDDAEPMCWKDVNQADLTRRVREMRETRAAPVAYAPVARLRKSTTVVDAVSRAEGFVDPLGLGFVDIRTVTLVRKGNDGDGLPASAPVSSDKENWKTRSFLKNKVMYHSEKFDPKVFLARIHQNTSAADLEAGEDALREDLQSRKNQLKKLVKDHFDCFISCKNTIDDIHTKLQQIESAGEGTGTLHLSNAIQEVDSVAKRAFAPLLERQAQAERIRSVQGMLQRFRTLFNLPSMIRANISKGEYDLAIREYKKAKSLVLYSHVGILSRVLEEVDKIIQQFKDMLYKKMEDPHVEISQLENTIRLLLELEPDSDPVWHYLTIQDRRIRGLLEACSLEHDVRMDALHGRVRERVQSDARWKQLQRESNKASNVDFNLLLGNNDKEIERTSLKDSTGNESDALLGRLIRRLTSVIVTHLPSFWSLALSIFNGKFSKPSVASNNESGQYPFEEAAESKIASHSVEEVVTMVHCIIALYESKVQTAFLALAEATVLRPYMRQAVAEISEACVAFEGKDCAPASALQMLLVLRTEVTRVFVLRLCALMHSATSELVNEEDWVPVAAVERSSSPFAISGLPLRFRDMIVSAMEHLTEMLVRLKRGPEHEDMITQVHQMQDTVHYTFFECFLTLAENLEKLAYELSRAAPLDDGLGPEEQASHDKFMGLIAGVEVTSPHQRLLMVLSNTGFCNSLLLPELSRKYQHVWSYSGGPGGNPVTAEEATASLSALEEKILGQYNLAKAASVGSAAAAYLLDDGTQWGASPPVKGIRDAVVELLHPVVAVHAEVYAGANPFVEKVINHLAAGLMDALLNVFTEAKGKVLKVLDVQGYCQLMLEVEYIEAVLGGYFTAPAREAAQHLRSLLWEKVFEFFGDTSDPVHARRSTRGSDDGSAIDGSSNLSLSAEDIQAIAQQIIAEHLPNELKRTRVNVFCFTEAVKTDMQGRRAASLQQRTQSTGFGAAALNLTRHRRKNSGSSLTDSDSGKPGSGLPPLSPYAGYPNSELGSDTGSGDMRPRAVGSDRFLRGQSEARRTRQMSSAWTSHNDG
ncbi:unnamed protein product [Sphagnum troendelagicum]|uniref:Exocyst complex component SEC5 n=1 Tax=Sphagnum troendelagicum TaxID=128251 RepID=A0ABP0V446_9BRYO